MSATSGASRLAGCCIGLRKFGGAESPMVELSQSLSDIPARRAATSARSRTDGSIPSTLHDTREFMLPSVSADQALHLRLHPPLASRWRDNLIPRCSSDTTLDSFPPRSITG